MNRVMQIRIILWSLIVLAVGLFLYLGIVPSGKIEYSSDFSSFNYFIGKLTPAERLVGKNILVNNPAYFSLYTPRSFDKALVTVKYRRLGDQTVSGLKAPLFEMGVLVDKALWRYKLSTVQNTMADFLLKHWHKTEVGTLTLLQRQISYDSVLSFLENPPDFDRTAIYNYDWQRNYVLPGYTAGVVSKHYGIPLRGDYQFYTYIKDEELKYDFVFFDLNQNKDADPIRINLYYNDRVIHSFSQTGDGVDNISNQNSQDMPVSFGVANLPEGFYKVEVKVNDDIVTKSMDTKQSKLSFAGKVRFWHDQEGTIFMYSDSRAVSALTTHPDRTQIIQVGDSQLDVNETYKQFSLDVSSAIFPYEVTMAADGLLLSGNGVFCFTLSEYLNPQVKRLERGINLENIDFALIDYVPPKEVDGWLVSEVEVDLNGAYRENNRYSFMLSLPGVEKTDGVEMKEMTIKLQGKTWWQKFREKL